MLHLLFHLLGKFQLVRGLFRPDRQIDGVQPVDAVITLRSFFLSGHFQQLVQADQFSFFSGHGDTGSIEAILYILRYQGKAYPFFLLVRIHVSCPQELLLIVLVDGRLNVPGGDTERDELPAIVFQPPLHRCRSTYVDPVDTRDTGKPRLDLILGKPLDKDRSCRRIQRIGHEWPRFFIIRTAHLQYRIA